MPSEANFRDTHVDAAERFTNFQRATLDADPEATPFALKAKPNEEEKQFAARQGRRNADFLAKTEIKEVDRNKKQTELLGAMLEKYRGHVDGKLKDLYGKAMGNYDELSAEAGNFKYSGEYRGLVGIHQAEARANSILAVNKEYSTKSADLVNQFLDKLEVAGTVSTDEQNKLLKYVGLSAGEYADYKTKVANIAAQPGVAKAAIEDVSQRILREVGKHASEGSVKRFVRHVLNRGGSQSEESFEIQFKGLKALKTNHPESFDDAALAGSKAYLDKCAAFTDSLRDITMEEHVLRGVESRVGELTVTAAEMQGHMLEETNRLAAEQAAEALKLREDQSEVRSLGHEFNDIGVLQNDLAEVSENSARGVIIRLQAGEDKAKYDREIAEHKMPAGLMDMQSEGWKSVDQLVSSEGISGADLPTMKSWFEGIKTLSAEAARERTGAKFMSLGKTTITGVSRESGLVVTRSENYDPSKGQEGTIEIRFASLEPGHEPVIRDDVPMVRIDATQMTKTLARWETLEKMAKEVQADSDLSVESSERMAVGQSTVLGHEGKALSGMSTKKALDAAIGKVKVQVANELRAAFEGEGVSKTSLTEAFQGMLDGRKKVGEELLNDVLVDSIGKLADRYHMKPSELTPELLATISASARDASNKAKELGAYLSDVDGVQDRILRGSLVQQEIAEMAKTFDSVDQFRAAYEALDIDPAVKDAGRETVKRLEAKIEKQARKLADRISRDLELQVPLPLRPIENGGRVVDVMDSVKMSNEDLASDALAIMREAGMKLPTRRADRQAMEADVLRRVSDFNTSDRAAGFELAEVVVRARDAMSNTRGSSRVEKIVKSLAADMAPQLRTTFFSEVKVDAQRIAQVRQGAEMAATADARIEAQRVAQEAREAAEALDGARAAELFTHGDGEQVRVVNALMSKQISFGEFVAKVDAPTYQSAAKDEAVRRLQVALNDRVRMPFEPGSETSLAGRSDLLEVLDWVKLNSIRPDTSPEQLAVLTNYYDSIEDGLVARGAEKKIA